jgi:hypothetical protein
MCGATKIKYASSHCKEEGLRYIWIDTCCIDKSSSAELSEAINSMYGWYEGSIVCYAYLEDVGRALSTQTSYDPSNKDKTVEESRWFTRGWTIQELIAPRMVDFFDKQWQYLGSKKDLYPLLSRITSIPEDVLLEPKNRRYCSVARKMTWAAKRQTTRIEDVAYSLLGIFDINMPLLYGEGRGAFIRLQEEILKETDDQSLLAWGLNGYMERVLDYGVFANSPDNFLGSEDVVPFPSKPGRQPHSMTNKGVRIELPVLADPTHLIPPELPFAILDCQIKDDFSGAIGISLMSTLDDSRFLRNPVMERITWPASELGGLESRTIYIAKSSTGAPKYTGRETCIIRATSAEDDGYDIFPIASTPGFWNGKTKVLHMASIYPAFPGHAPTAIAFFNPGKKSCFIVVIAPIPDWGDSQRKMRVPIRIFAGPVGGDPADLEKWVREGPLSGYKMGWKDDDKVVLPNASVPSGWMTISARMTREHILNQMVLVLSVDLL